MNNLRDWRQTRVDWTRLLEENTGEDLGTWMSRIESEKFSDEQGLRAWLTRQGVTGYAQSLLVMEQFGYPDFMVASADQLIDGQYADRAQLRPVFDAILNAVVEFGEVTVQARKTYVSLVSARRTFARVQPTTKTRLDLGLRLEGQSPGGRLGPSTIHETMKLQVSIYSVDEVDAEVLSWLRRAYDENS
jgi:hypothetical protein